MNGAYLDFNVVCFGPAITVSVGYNKKLFDPLSGENHIATTWTSSSVGTHGGDPGHIVQALSEQVDKFVVEYLRVNGKDCPR